MEDPERPSWVSDWPPKRNGKWPNRQRETPLKHDTGNKWEEESSLSFPTIRSQNRWVIIVLSFHHILRGICDDLFRTAADMVGGVGPFDHGVSCQFVVQHFEISLPCFFFWPISSYITISSNIVYLPIFTGIVSVISLCSMIHNWFFMTLSGIDIGKKSAVIVHCLMSLFWCFWYITYVCHGP